MMTVRSDLITRFRRIRQASMDMCAPLEPEQCRVQSSIEVSPPWWNLAHTSWFFSRNVLQAYGGKKTPEDDLFDYILNSYYAALGPRMERHRRGFLTRPTMKEVYIYRQSIDDRVTEIIQSIDDKKFAECAAVVEIGLQHEQQHQELFYTEIKHILFQNPPLLRVPYCQFDTAKKKSKRSQEAYFIEIPGGLYDFGNLEGKWGWDNEQPIHKYYINDFALQNRLVTNGEYLEFIDDGGYENQLLWLDNGWEKVREHKWMAPLYWEYVDGEWQIWTLTGSRKLDLNEPVCHVSFYEAEAYADWKGARLPSEREWELAARLHSLTPDQGNFIDSSRLHPQASQEKGLTQMLGDVWEWTNSYYEPYPGYMPFEGKLREYNEKFMDNQRTLRGGSCVSERDHLRISYRNFWPPECRFQFTGIRLAQNTSTR